MALIRFMALLLALLATASAAHEQDNNGDVEPAYTITPVFQHAMSDPELEGYEMLALRLDILPGGVDAAPHRHDADLFVYVLQGGIEVELDGEKAQYSAGAMFHEPRNMLHSLLRNTSDDLPASILAVFVIKEGREPVVPVTE